MAVRYRREAQRSLAQIYSHIRRSNPFAASRVVTEIRERIDGLDQLSERFRDGVIAGTRELIIGKYGYIVVYRVEGADVVVIKVFHAAQDKPRGG